jgi:hypothetical protein
MGEEKKKSVIVRRPPRRTADLILSFRGREIHVTTKPLDDIAERRLPPALRGRLEAIRTRAIEDPEGALPVIEDLSKGYPEYAPFQDWLSGIHRALGDREKAEAAARQYHRRYPDRIHGMCYLARSCIDKGRFASVPALLRHRFDLPDILPSRQRFHISEVVAFSGVVGSYYALLGAMAEARAHHDLLVELAPTDPTTQALGDLLLGTVWPARRRVKGSARK